MSRRACHLPACFSAQTLCLELWWVGKHLASPRAPETRNALGTVSGSHRLTLASGERRHRRGSTSPSGCCLALAMSPSPG